MSVSARLAPSFLTATDFCAIARHTHFIISLDAIRLPRCLEWASRNGEKAIESVNARRKCSKNQKSYKKIKIIISLD